MLHSTCCKVRAIRLLKPYDTGGTIELCTTSARSIMLVFQLSKPTALLLLSTTCLESSYPLHSVRQHWSKHCVSLGGTAPFYGISSEGARLEISRSFVLEDKRWSKYLRSGSEAARGKLSSFSKPSFIISCAMKRRTSMLDILPIELLMLVRDFIPEIQLRTHVCFAQVCGPAAKTLYTEDYWETMSVKFALGLFPEEDVSTICWKDFVYDIILKDGFCDHPNCGMQRLTQNCGYPAHSLRDTSGRSFTIHADREMNKVYMKDYSRSGLTQILEGSSESSCRGLVANSIFANLEFSPSTHTDIMDDGYICSRGPWRQSHRRSLLSGHPIASRSYATFAPISKLQPITLNIPLVQNPNGVTVWDVYAAVQARYVLIEDAVMHAADACLEDWMITVQSTS